MNRPIRPRLRISQRSPSGRGGVTSILVTGARDAVASGLAARLSEQQIPLHRASRTPGTVHFDLTDPATFSAALEGIRAVFLYAEAAAIDAFVKAAVNGGVEHVVLLSSSSVLAADAADSAPSASHLAVEHALLASPLRTTLLRPGSFASNARGWAWALKSGSAIRLPYPGSYSDPLHEADIIDAAFAVLTNPALVGRAYTLTGPQALTFSAQLTILADVLGRHVPYENRHPRAVESRGRGLHPRPLRRCPPRLLGRAGPPPRRCNRHRQAAHRPPARTFETWVRDHSADFAA